MTDYLTSRFKNYHATNMGGIDRAVTSTDPYYGGWVDYHFHGLNGFVPYTEADGTAVNTSADWLDYWFSHYIQPLRDDRSLWCATYRVINRYAQERDSATLTVTQNGQNGFSVSIHDMMDDTVYTQALTVKIMVDETWKGVTAVNAEGEAVHAELVTYDEGTFLYVDVVPDTGAVIVTSVAGQTVGEN